MPCKTCGAATMTIESSRVVKTGPFEERVECANGHTGTVKGREEEPPTEWTKYGAVFQNE